MKSNISLHYKLIVENPSSFCQPLFRRQQLSYNSRQTTRRDKNLLFQKIVEMIPSGQCKIVYVNKYINDHISLSVLRSHSEVIIGICCTLTKHGILPLLPMRLY